MYKYTEVEESRKALKNRLFWWSRDNWEKKIWLR
jgi:hypothetical protein